MPKLPTLEDFNAYIKALATHDWWYDFSEDPKAYQEGRDERVNLDVQARSHPVYRQAYAAYNDYQYGQDHIARRLVKRDDTVEAIRRYLINEHRNQVVVIA